MKTLKQKIEVMYAARFGAKIEYIASSDPNYTWTRCYPANDDYYQWDWITFDYRIAQPVIAPGHNPAKLTVEQVETNLGWRLLEPDEIKDRGNRHFEIQALGENQCAWNSSGFTGCHQNVTYRTKLTREQLAQLDKPQPKQHLPLGPEDFPPGTLLRCSKEWPKHSWFLYHLTTAGLGVWWPDVERHHTWSNLTSLYLERSLDGGKTWLPCYREE